MTQERETPFALSAQPAQFMLGRHLHEKKSGHKSIHTTFIKDQRHMYFTIIDRYLDPMDLPLLEEDFIYLHPGGQHNHDIKLAFNTPMNIFTPRYSLFSLQSHNKARSHKEITALQDFGHPGMGRNRRDFISTIFSALFSKEYSVANLNQLLNKNLSYSASPMELVMHHIARRILQRTMNEAHLNTRQIRKIEAITNRSFMQEINHFPKWFSRFKRITLSMLRNINLNRAVMINNRNIQHFNRLHTTKAFNYIRSVYPQHLHANNEFVRYHNHINRLEESHAHYSHTPEIVNQNYYYDAQYESPDIIYNDAVYNDIVNNNHHIYNTLQTLQTLQPLQFHTDSQIRLETKDIQRWYTTVNNWTATTERILTENDAAPSTTDPSHQSVSHTHFNTNHIHRQPITGSPGSKPMISNLMRAFFTSHYPVSNFVTHFKTAPSYTASPMEIVMHRVTAGAKTNNIHHNTSVSNLEQLRNLYHIIKNDVHHQHHREDHTHHYNTVEKTNQAEQWYRNLSIHKELTAKDAGFVSNLFSALFTSNYRYFNISGAFKKTLSYTASPMEIMLHGITKRVLEESHKYQQELKEKETRMEEKRYIHRFSRFHEIAAGAVGKTTNLDYFWQEILSHNTDPSDFYITHAADEHALNYLETNEDILDFQHSVDDSPAIPEQAIKDIEKRFTTHVQKMQTQMEEKINASMTNTTNNLNLSHLADNVYSKIFNRLRRERSMRGY